jgi:hypothetical protein
MNWICLCEGMQAPTNPNLCILACRTHCNRGNGKVQMVRNESPET